MKNIFSTDESVKIDWLNSENLTGSDLENTEISVEFEEILWWHYFNLYTHFYGHITILVFVTDKLFFKKYITRKKFVHEKVADSVLKSGIREKCIKRSKVLKGLYYREKIILSVFIGLNDV